VLRVQDAPRSGTSSSCPREFGSLGSEQSEDEIPLGERKAPTPPRARSSARGPQRHWDNARENYRCAA
jgi:hypothetical protein